MAELVGVMVGHYFLLECLRHEGMVETYRARPTTRGGCDVALRLFRPQFTDPAEFREHFAAEAEKVLRCHHEHIEPMLEFGAGDGLLYSVTPLTEAETLEQFLERQQGHFLPLTQVVQLVTQICAALQHAHQQGIVHGNVQPASIVMQHQEHVLLTHFGMRRAYCKGGSGDPCGHPVAQIDEGNPAYVAPEQALGMLCPASDIYALGVLLYRLLGGVLPYDGESAGEIALKHTEEPIPSLRLLRPELPEALELVVRVALAKSPGARFSTPAALAQALLSALTPGASPIITVLPQRRVVTKLRYTSFTWTRATSILALFIVLFGLASTLLFVFTPLQHSTAGNWLRNTDGRSVLPGYTPVSTASATSVTSTSPLGTVTPTSGSGSHLHLTPTAGQTQTPIPGTTVSPNPTVTQIAIPSTIVCVTGTLSIDGSPNLEPLLQQVGNAYQALCPGLAIVVSGNGFRSALNGLRHGQIDMAASDETIHHIQSLTDQYVGALLYAVIVSPEVQISGLSSAELQGIYSGQITNWAQVGGPDEPITVVLRPPRDLVTAVFRTFVLRGAEERVKGIKLKEDQMNLVVQTVTQIPGAISYVPLAEAQDSSVHVLSIDGGSPGTQSLRQGTYAFWSVEHLYTQGDGTPQAQAYMQFLTSTHVVNIMDRFGVVRISLLPQNVVASHLPGPEGG